MIRRSLAECSTRGCVATISTPGSAGTTNKRIRTVVRGGKRTTVTEETTIKYEKEWLDLELGRAYARWGRFDEARDVFERSRGGADPVIDLAIERELLLLAASGNEFAAVAAHAEAAQAALARAMTDSSAGDVRELGAALTADLERYAREYAAFAAVTDLGDVKASAETLARLANVTPGRVDFSTPEGYRTHVVEAQLGWSLPRLRACYARPLQSQARFAGQVSLLVVPEMTGSTTLSQLAPAAGDEGLAAVAACVARVAAKWRMTPALGATTTSAKIELRFETR